MNMNKKSFVMGIALASTFFIGYNAFAVGGKIEAYLKDDYKIEVDGIELKQPDDMRILNFCDRTYTPARLIAEAMDGKVEWDDATKTIKITKPEPKVVEKVVEKIVEVPVDPKVSYQSAPLKLTKSDFTMELTGISVKDNLTYVYLEVKNKAGEAVDLDFSNAKIKAESGEYKANIGVSANDWGQSIDVNEDKKSGVMAFEKIADSDKDITVSIPVKSVTKGSLDETFEYNVKVD